MLFNSVNFLVFFPIVLLVYYVLPAKVRQYWLLIASYYFYMCWNAKYILLILFSTVITYSSGLLMENTKKAHIEESKKVSRKKVIVALSFVLNLLVLFYFKYINFGIDMLTSIFAMAKINLEIPKFDILLPVGISFFTFQALSYTMDVYRDEIYAEKNFFKYALFVSFFPQLVAGPIERSKNLLKQLSEPKPFSINNAREGVLLMLWGYFLKVVLADRIAIFVDGVYNDVVTYTGLFVVLATVLFAFQIYCDFAGYTVIAMGAAKIMGIKLTDNFQAPYYATSVADFWRRWHISLTSWFKDYLYIPLGGSRKGKIRKYINKMIVFLVSGLWHGASMSFVVWGGLNGLYQVIGEVLDPVRLKVRALLKINVGSIIYKVIAGFITFIMVDFAWLFFRAQNMKNAVAAINSMFSNLSIDVFKDGSLYSCGLDIKNFWLMILGILILMVTDFFKNKKIVIRNIVMNKPSFVRVLIIDAAVIILLIFGIYGISYDAAKFIYFQF